MRRTSAVLAATVGAAALVSFAGPAVAGTNTAWTWNNNSDKDVKARFESVGEHV